MTTIQRNRKSHQHSNVKDWLTQSLIILGKPFSHIAKSYTSSKSKKTK